MEILLLEEKTMIDLQSFVSVAEMDEVVREYKERYDLSTTDREILDVIS